MHSNPTAGATLGTSKAGSRILPIDAARGFVMLFSCLAHFAWWIHSAYPRAGDTLAAVGMVATPTFLLMSGAMVGMLCATALQHGRDLRSQLLNRGLFLMTVGHVLIASAEAHQNGSFWLTLRGVTVVDEIGLCTLIAAFLVPRLADSAFCSTLAKIAALALGLSWIANLFWQPGGAIGLEVEKVLIGGRISPTEIVAHTPTLQQMAIYCVGLPLGHFFARYVRREITLQDVSQRLLVIGALLASAAIALRALRFYFDLLPALHSPALDLTLRITEKTPPSPGYLLFFGGCALLLTGSLFRLAASPRPLIHASLEWLAVIGRASLMVFVLQYFLYWTLPDLLDVHPDRLAAMVFIVNVLLIRLVAGAWGRVRGNRWMTFGIKLGRTSPLRN
jgi:uncharacterized membrane protein